MTPERTFEELQRELDELVARLERGDVPLDEALGPLGAGRGALPRVRQSGSTRPSCASRSSVSACRASRVTARRRKGKVGTPWPSRVAELIRSIPIFADLDDASVKQLASDFIEREFAAGQAIATEGEGGLNFFVVESGTADVSVGGQTVGSLGPGASFGEVALVDKSARSATVTATSQLRAFALPVWSFRSFAESRPSVTWKLLELLAERLRAAEHR